MILNKKQTVIQQMKGLKNFEGFRTHTPFELARMVRWRRSRRFQHEVLVDSLVIHSRSWKERMRLRAILKEIFGDDV